MKRILILFLFTAVTAMGQVFSDSPLAHTYSIVARDSAPLMPMSLVKTRAKTEMTLCMMPMW